MIRSTVLALTLFIATPVLAVNAAAVDTTADDGTTYLMCKNKTVVRTVRISKKSSGGCQTTYTKEGIDQIVSESWIQDRCEKVLNNIKENLEKASWKCKDISDARVSASQE